MVRKADIMRVDALSAEDVARWRAWQLQNRDFHNPFFHPDFTRAAASAVPGVRMARISEGQEIIGYWPFQIRSGTVYPVAAPMNDYHGVITKDGVSIDLEELTRLLGARRISVNSWVGQSRLPQRQTCQVFLGEGGYEAWFAAQRTSFPKYFKDKMRSLRGMEANLGPVQVKTRQRDPHLLDQLIALKSAQYGSSGLHDIFGVQWTRKLLAELLKSDTGLQASIATLHAGERLLALELSLHADGVWHFWFPAYLMEGARYSPGIWLSLETIRIESETGISEFDYGFVGEAYKKYFCNQVREVTEGVAGRPGWIDRLVPVIGSPATARSARHRWAAIEAVETDWVGRARGVARAASSFVTRQRTGES